MNSDRWQSSSPELMRAAVEKIALVRREYAEFLEIVAELNSRRAATEFGYGSSEKMVAELGSLNIGDARRTVRRIGALHDSVGIGGAVIPAALPATAAAFADGEISVAHVDLIAEFRRDLPDFVDAETWRVAEQTLADIARTVPPRGLRRPIEELRARLDPDGREPSDAELAQPHRELRTVWRGDELHFAGVLDREAGTQLEAALSPLASPRPEYDARTTAERHGDAFAELVTLAVRSPALPAEAGGPVTVLLTMDETALREGIGAATTVDGHAVPTAQLRRMACEAGIIPTVLGSAGQVVDMGSRVRTAPASVRNRLIVRDRGCAFPGCARPPSHCQAHHIVHWADGGTTSPDNLVLICAHHHRAVHHTRWQVRMGADGLPEFLPPDYLDPLRVPRRQPRAA